MTPATPSRSSFDWQPSSANRVIPISRGYNSRVSRTSNAWSAPKRHASTAEMIAQQFGIPVPHWAKQGVHWSQALYLGRGKTISGYQGLGQVSPQQISAIASTGASATIGILVALGTIAGPIGAVAAGLIAVANLLVGVFKGCGQTCVQASDIANQVDSYMAQNLATYLAAPVHYASLQAAAINNFNTAWAALEQACGAAALEQAGQNCISQRQQGACAYKTSPGGWQQQSGTWVYVYPGANGSGSTCWDYFVGFLDPIQNDPTVVPDPLSTTTTSTSGTTTTVAAAPDYSPLLLVGAGLLALLVLL